MTSFFEKLKLVKYLYSYSVPSKYPTDNSFLVLSCTIQGVAKSLYKFYIETFAFWAVGLLSPSPCPTMLYVYFCRIYVSTYWQNSLVGQGGGGRTFIKTFSGFLYI